MLKKCIVLLSAYLNVIVAVSAENNSNPKSFQVTQMYFALDVENYNNCWVKLGNDCVVIGSRMGGPSIGRGVRQAIPFLTLSMLGFFIFHRPYVLARSYTFGSTNRAIIKICKLLKGKE